MSDERQLRIDVAGDVCLDMVGIPVPPPSGSAAKNNWQLTGETQTHYLLGGAMLLAEWVRAAAKNAEVRGMRPRLPDELKHAKPAEAASTEAELTDAEFLKIAERLKRDEVVHSLLALDHFKLKPDDKKNCRLRVKEKHGFSGPESGEPSLELSPPDDRNGSPDIVVLDDTGNRFRRMPSQWPRSLTSTDAKPLIVYKLHRPLPDAEGQSVDHTPRAIDDTTSDLWRAVAEKFSDQRIVVLSIEDLRVLDAPISYGLSWERTALDVVWQLLNVDRFAHLRDCKHLIVRFDLDGALYWSRRQVVVKGDKESTEIEYRAWLIYDPNGIEGTAELSVEGTMVGYGSAFTAAIVKHLAAVSAEQRATLGNTNEVIDKPLEDGIKAGLRASRELLKAGYDTKDRAQPKYPRDELFPDVDQDHFDFACQPIPILKHAAIPDRGYWRLLDSIFDKKPELLHRAVELTARDVKPAKVAPEPAAVLLRQVPMAVYEGLRTHDRRELENYRALFSLMRDYAHQTVAKRPLNIAVFGPPGAGKSFGVKQVAKALGKQGGTRPIESLTFNLSQYQHPDQLADAFHLVRDVVLKGNIPLVFFDEFDTSLGGVPLGWLRYFLAPMQDAEFLDRGAPHPIGQAIFVFAGGTSDTYAEFAQPFLDARTKSPARIAFKTAKGPDFLSRLRGTLDIPGLDLYQPFDAYGPIESLPCEAAILLRRANILAFQLKEKCPTLGDADGTLQVSPEVLRALLHMPKFVHGNRSFEAVLDMSRLFQTRKFTPSTLPGPGHLQLHAEASHIGQLLGTVYPFPNLERDLLAKSIHEAYRAQRLKESQPPDPRTVKEVRPWDSLSDTVTDEAEIKDSNRRQADDIARKLRSVGLWFRKIIVGAGTTIDPGSVLRPHLETLARLEHDRWVAEKRRKGWIAASGKDRRDRNDPLKIHNFIFPWDDLDDTAKDLDREPVRQIPMHLAVAGYEIVRV